MGKDIWSGKEHFLRDQNKKSISSKDIKDKISKIKQGDILKLIKGKIGFIILIIILLAILVIPRLVDKESVIEGEAVREIVIDDEAEDLEKYRNLSTEELLNELYGKEVRKVHPLRELEMTSGAYYFEPDEIRVNLDDLVRIDITSNDLNYTLRIPGFFVSKEIDIDRKTTIEFIASKEGEFIINSPDYEEMSGKIIVEDTEKEQEE